MSDAKLNIEISVDDKGTIHVKKLGEEAEKAGKKAEDGFKRGGRSIRDFNEMADRGYNGMMRLAGQATAVVAGFYALKVSVDTLISSTREWIDLANQQEEAESNLQSVLRATGEAAGFNFQQLKDMAAAMQGVTTTGDEVIMSGMAILLTFKEVRGEGFERATMAALDMSRILKKDLNSSIMQIGKALNDPITGMNALSRSGVSFTQQQKDMVEQLQESGRMIEAQNIILAELEGEFGGAAKAAREDFMGAVDAAANALGDLEEEFGFVITKNAAFKQLFVEAERLINDLIVVMQDLRETGQLDVWATDMALGVVSSFQKMVKAGGYFYNLMKDTEWLINDIYNTFDKFQVNRMKSELGDLKEDLSDLGKEATDIKEKMEFALEGKKYEDLDLQSQIIYDKEQIKLDDNIREQEELNKNISETTSQIELLEIAIKTAQDRMRGITDDQKNFDAGMQQLIDSLNEMKQHIRDAGAAHEDHADALGKAGDAAGEAGNGFLESTGAVEAFEEAAAKAVFGGGELALGATHIAENWALAARQLNAAEAELEKLIELEKQAAKESLNLAEKGSQYDLMWRMIEEREAAEKEQTAIVEKEEQKRLDAAKQAAEEQQRIWEQSLENVQNWWADTFYQIFDGQITGFDDFADRMLDVFKRMLAEMAAAAIMQPIVVPVMQSVSGAMGDLFGGGGSGGGGFNMPSFGGGGNIVDLLPDSITGISLSSGVTTSTIASLGIGYPGAYGGASVAGGLTLGGALSAAMPYIGIAATAFTLLSSLSSLFGSNAGWGFSMPSTTSGWGQGPITVDDLSVAGGSNGTSLEELSEVTGALIDGINDVVDATAASIETFADMLPAEAAAKLKAALSSLEITLPEWGINEENYQEMIEDIIAHIGAAMKKAAAPVIADAFEAQFSEMGWGGVTSQMSQGSDVRQKYEEMAALIDYVQLQQEDLGEVNEETAEEMLQAIVDFNDAVVAAVAGSYAAIASGVSDALSAASKAEGLQMLHDQLEQQLWDATVQGIINGLLAESAMTPYLAQLRDMFDTGIAEFVENGTTEGLKAAFQGFEDVFNTYVKPLFETVYDVDQEMNPEQPEHESGITYQVAGSSTYTEKEPRDIRYILDAIADALHETSPVDAIVRETQYKWEDMQEVLREEGKLTAEHREVLRQYGLLTEEMEAMLEAEGRLTETMQERIDQARHQEILDAVNEFKEGLTSSLEALYNEGALFYRMQAEGVTEARAAYDELWRWRKERGLSDTLTDFTGMDFTEMEEYSGMLTEVYALYMTALENQLSDWRAVEETAQTVLEGFQGALEAEKSVLADIPVLAGQSVEEVGDYVSAMSDWLNAAVNLRASLTSFRDQAAAQIANVQKDAALYGLDDAAKKAWYDTQISAGISGLYAMSPEDALTAAYELTQMVSERYAIEKQQIDEITSAIEKWTDLLETISDKILELRYSEFNRALPVERLEVSKEDYATLLTAARTGSPEDVEKFLDFTNTALAESMSYYASSQGHLDFFDQVMRDLEDLGLSVEDRRTEEEQSLSAIEDAAANAVAALESIDTAIYTQQAILDAEIASQTTALEELLGESGAIATGIGNTISAIDNLSASLAETINSLTAAIDYSVEQSTTVVTARPHTYSSWSESGGFSQTVWEQIAESTTDRFRVLGSVTYAAEGAIVERPTYVMAGEAGNPEAFIPLSSRHVLPMTMGEDGKNDLAARIAEAVAAAVGGTGASQEIRVTIPLVVDGVVKETAEKVIKITGDKRRQKERAWG